MRRILFLTISLLITTIIYGQKIPTKYLRGSFYQTIGEPGRTYQSNDSTHVSIPPLTYSETILKLKRGGRATIEVKNNVFYEMSHTQKAKWELNNDTLTLTVKNYDKVEKYLISPTHEKVLYLKAITQQMGYTRQN